MTGIEEGGDGGPSYCCWWKPRQADGALHLLLGWKAGGVSVIQKGQELSAGWPGLGQGAKRGC